MADQLESRSEEKRKSKPDQKTKRKGGKSREGDHMGTNIKNLKSRESREKKHRGRGIVKNRI